MSKKKQNGLSVIKLAGIYRAMGKRAPKDWNRTLLTSGTESHGITDAQLQEMADIITKESALCVDWLMSKKGK